jgi:hypothetical protein
MTGKMSEPKARRQMRFYHLYHRFMPGVSPCCRASRIFWANLINSSMTYVASIACFWYFYMAFLGISAKDRARTAFFAGTRPGLITHKLPKRPAFGIYCKAAL